MTDRFISCGKIVTIIFTAGYFVGYAVYFIYFFSLNPEKVTNKQIHVQNLTNGYTFLAIAVLMLIVNTFLFFQIETKNRALSQDRDYF